MSTFKVVKIAAITTTTTTGIVYISVLAYSDSLFSLRAADFMGDDVVVVLQPNQPTNPTAGDLCCCYCYCCWWCFYIEQTEIINK